MNSMPHKKNMELWLFSADVATHIKYYTVIWLTILSLYLVCTCILKKSKSEVCAIPKIYFTGANENIGLKVNM